MMQEPPGATPLPPPTAPAYRLLLVEDNQGDRDLARAGLSDVPGFSLTIDEAPTLKAAIAMVDAHQYDSLVIDLNLPDSWGLATLCEIRRRSASTPIVVLSGDERENLRADVLREGALDFLSKNDASPEFAARAILYSLERHRSEAQGRRIEQFLSESRDGVVVTDTAGIVLFVNDAALSLLGRTRADLLGTQFGFDFSHGGAKEEVFHTADRKTAEVRVVPYVWNHRDAYLATMRDVTERTRLADQLRHAQKLEAVGQLAGGVAHDFNNILTVILASAEIVLDGVREPDPAHRWVVDIQQAGRRAAALTRQLLTFARRHVNAPRVVDVNGVVTTIHKMLGRLIGEHVTMRLRLARSLPPVVVDADQMGQVLTNLIVNARDAMPHGGTIEIATAAHTLPEHGRSPWSLPAGGYVQLTVRDTGEGMSREIVERVFEPFFTTKEDRGTGLGLAMVHGIVTQANGEIRVDSEKGVGSTFTILLPVAPASADEAAAAATEPDRLTGHERILVVEDEVPVRTVATEILRRAGYVVETASSGPAAIDLARTADSFDLVLTDVVMPGMSGWALGERLRADRPGQRVIYMSGYSHEVLAQHGVAASSFTLLQKPFTRLDLLRAVRRALDAKE